MKTFTFGKASEMELRDRGEEAKLGMEVKERPTKKGERRQGDAARKIRRTYIQRRER